ncbi:MAG: thioesterase [Alphaproteobacteria bacterium]|nr:thioesterase [Alphaproteobacteria bacterium]
MKSKPGDHVVVKTCFIDFTEKWLHVWSVMINRITDDVCAINDQRCVHFDTNARSSTPFPTDICERGRSLVRERPEV